MILFIFIHPPYLTIVHTISRYEVLEELGKGGMGVVFKARDPRLERMVALKLLSHELTENSEWRKRFLREAKLTSSLQHPNICTIHEVDETPQGDHFISMDYYEGETLRQLITRGLSSMEQLIAYAIQIADGLAHAHARGIIHRDIKPENIMVTTEGQVKILDFGLARMTTTKGSTRTGELLGSVAYCSPEQAQGQRVNHLTDIWSAGVVLYEMTTGVLPFAHEYEAAVLYSILDKSPVPPSEINEQVTPDLEKLIYRCLRKKQEERLASAEMLSAELKRIQGSLQPSPRDMYPGDDRKDRRVERRLVTLLIVEVSNLENLYTGKNEVEAMDLLELLQAKIERVARQFGGIVTGRTDYGATILYGMAERGENAPVQAINAAISLRTPAPDRDNVERIDFKLHIAIDTGYAIVKTGREQGSDTYSALGGPLSVSHHLVKLAAEGEILVGPLTRSISRPLFEFREQQPFQLPGRSDPVPLFLLISNQIRDIRKHHTEVRHGRSGLVGREEELENLQFQMLKLYRGEGSIVSVTGEAGVGKSRLIGEFLSRQKSEKYRLLQGSAQSSGEVLSFHPLIEQIKCLAGIEAAEAEQPACEKLEQCVRSICPSEADEVFPFIATLMGMHMDQRYSERINKQEGEGLEKLILKNLRTLLTEASRQQPLLILTEDLHWADQSSLRMLRSLYWLAESFPILFVSVFRPGYTDTGDALLESARDRYGKIHAEIGLQPLEAAHSEHLVRNLLKVKTLSREVHELVFRQAEGNPLYTEEMVASLEDEGILETGGNEVRISGKALTTNIPRSIQGILMTRIDKLSEDARNLLKIASVIGRNFSQELLSRITPDFIPLNASLEKLVKSQLIRGLGKREFQFKHALIHQAVYESLPESHQKELHRNLGRAIEELCADRLQDYYGILSYHFGLGEDPDKTEDYLVRAGDVALRSSASIEALHYFREALSIYLEKKGTRADAEKVATLHKNIALAHFSSGHFIETSEYLEKVLDHYHAGVPRSTGLLLPGALAGLVAFLFKLRFPSLLGRKQGTNLQLEINDLIDKKLFGLTITRPLRYVLETMYYAPRLSRYTQDYGRRIVIIATLFGLGGISLKIFGRILDFCNATFSGEDQLLQIHNHFMGSFYHLITGRWYEDEYDESEIDYGFRNGIIYLSNTHGWMLVHIYTERGDRHAEHVLNRMSDFAEMYEYDYGRLAHHSHSALYHYKFREYEKVVNQAPAGAEWIRRTMGNKPGQVMTLSIWVKALYMLGEKQAMKEAFDEVWRMAGNEFLSPYFQSFYLTATLMVEITRLEEAMDAGKAREIRRRRTKIRRTKRKALRNCRKVAYERMETYRLIGVAYWVMKREKRALRWWSKTWRTCEELGAKLERAHTLKELSIRLAGRKGPFERLGGFTPEEMEKEAHRQYQKMNIPTDR